MPVIKTYICSDRLTGTSGRPQIGIIMKLAQRIADKVYPILDGNRHQSSERLNQALLQEIEPMVNEPVELLIKLVECSVPNSGNKHVFDEVRKYLASLK